MAKPISVPAFVSASARHVKSAVTQANADQNSFLTKAESAKLPADLQDNFAGFRKKGTANGSVAVKNFVEGYPAYVAANAAKADRNKDGKLSGSEAKSLPTDLKDNFAAFASGKAAPPASKSLQTPKERMDSIYNRQLPASNSFGKMAKLLDQQLADGNIMSGEVGCASGRLSNKNPTDAEFKDWAVTLTMEYLAAAEGGAKANNVKAELLSPAKALKRATTFIAEGNAYGSHNTMMERAVLKGDPEEGLLGLEDLTRKLGTPAKCVIVTGKVPEDDDPSEMNKLGMAIFLNTKTGQFIGFYGREGHV